ncbi:hypothetical protein SCHPADRAFT_909771 [Schizopora paradoxa]|uniref:Uncharacterized protein n=1 Tax=Schizopora paradoxa TaxID=27342 RepID=A0A0H2RCB1_9AGAM|nr:hypothetical protein SCHPADRAFT_909771 [Schizopora paradoxa]
MLAIVHSTNHTRIRVWRLVLPFKFYAVDHCTCPVLHLRQRKKTPRPASAQPSPVAVRLEPSSSSPAYRLQSSEFFCIMVHDQLCHCTLEISLTECRSRWTPGVSSHSNSDSQTGRMGCRAAGARGVRTPLTPFRTHSAVFLEASTGGEPEAVGFGAASFLKWTICSPLRLTAKSSRRAPLLDSTALARLALSKNANETRRALRKNLLHFRFSKSNFLFTPSPSILILILIVLIFEHEARTSRRIAYLHLARYDVSEMKN